MSREEDAWQQCVMPELRRHLKAQEWVSTESQMAERVRNKLRQSRAGIPELYDLCRIASILDTQCGIDGFLTSPAGPISVAKRLQFFTTTRGWGYSTITVRAERPTRSRTELDKLMTYSTVKPQLHVHGYVRMDDRKQWQLDCLIAAENRTILQCDQWRPFTNSQDGTKFRAYAVRDLQAAAYEWNHQPVIYVDRYRR